MHINVASSWRNTYYPDVVTALRNAGHDVYDFRNPPSGDPGFHWSDVDPNCMDWTPAEYQANLSHPFTERQFKNDIEAMTACDACVLVLPCGSLRTQKPDGSLVMANLSMSSLPTKIALNRN